MKRLSSSQNGSPQHEPVGGHDRATDVTAHSAVWDRICSWPPQPNDSADPWDVWVRAVHLMAAGNYRGAFNDLAGLTGAGIGSTEPELAGLAQATLGSGLRQLGCHEAAVAHDDRAIAAGGRAALDGFVGRAADEVGRGHTQAARGDLRAARTQLTECSDQAERGATRIGWVAAEIALLAEEPAVPAATVALSAAERLGSPRHVLKSRLILAVARLSSDGDTEPRAQGISQLGEVLTTAVEFGLPTLAWPAALALGQDLSSSQRALVTEPIDFIAHHLPEGLGTQWLGAVSHLRTTGPAWGG